ncbi:MAG: hypothetical protein C0403_09040 [Desulfobacterium sp.]|nr:hypothetical protein [Desulfobacterium sp.]
MSISSPLSSYSSIKIMNSCYSSIPCLLIPFGFCYYSAEEVLSIKIERAFVLFDKDALDEI